MCERQVVPALQKKWCDTDKEDSWTPPRRADTAGQWHKLTVPNLVSLGWPWGRWGYKRQGVSFRSAEKDGQGQARGHTPTQCTQGLAGIQKDVLRTHLKSGSFMVLWEKICIVVVLYTHTNTYPQHLYYKAALEEKHFYTHTATIYGCLPPASTLSDFTRGLVAAVGRSFCPYFQECSLMLNTPTQSPWQVTGDQTLTVYISKMTYPLHVLAGSRHLGLRPVLYG